MEFLVISIFVVFLLLCLILDVSILWALAAGYLLFFLYSIRKGFSAKETLSLSIEGVLTVKNILITFLLIGMMTALWRAAGTIPSIVCYALTLVSPGIFLLLTFLLNCLLSFLTGTSFGTSATMGVVCMTIGQAMGLSPVWMGGAILSGAFFGDRCSPVSTSALLVAELTRTEIWDNIYRMVKTSLVPFAATCLIYLGVGFFLPHTGGEILDVRALFRTEFVLGLIPLIPAVIMFGLSIAHVNVKPTMLASILAAAAICLFLQDISPAEILRIMVFGYEPANPQLTTMISGGGITSMIRVGLIVCISSSYSGIFKATGLLDPMKEIISRRASRGRAFPIILLTSIVTSVVACNQTLATILTKQLCDTAQPDLQQLAVDMENSVIIISPLIPWCIAGAVPLATVGAPQIALLASCYLYLVPLWNLVKK